MSVEDYGAEEWEFPSLEDVTPEEAAKLWDAIERQASKANKRAALLKERKAAAKTLAINAVEASPYTSVRIELEDGREVNLTPYDWDVFSVKDEEAFKEWAAGEAENYYDDTPRLRDGVFLDEMRRRVQDQEPLPPGVVRWTDTKISRTAAPSRRRRRRTDG